MLSNKVTISHLEELTVSYQDTHSRRLTDTLMLLVWPPSWTPAVGGLFVCECVCACVRACVRVCVRVRTCVRARVRTCMRARVCV